MQNNEGENDLHLLSSQEAVRACVLSVTKYEVACGGSGPIYIVSSNALSLQGLFVPAEPIERLRAFKEIGIEENIAAGAAIRVPFGK